MNDPSIIILQIAAMKRLEQLGQEYKSAKEELDRNRKKELLALRKRKEHKDKHVDQALREVQIGAEKAQEVIDKLDILRVSAETEIMQLNASINVSIVPGLGSEPAEDLTIDEHTERVAFAAEALKKWLSNYTQTRIELKKKQEKRDRLRTMQSKSLIPPDPPVPLPDMTPTTAAPTPTPVDSSVSKRVIALVSCLVIIVLLISVIALVIVLVVKGR